MRTAWWWSKSQAIRPTCYLIEKLRGAKGFSRVLSVQPCKAGSILDQAQHCTTDVKKMAGYRINGTACALALAVPWRLYHAAYARLFFFCGQLPARRPTSAMSPTRYIKL